MGAGRQRAFDKEDVLAKAIELFWRNGYSGTSLSDLTKAMGINKPSLYAAFGNKEELFVSALNQYVLEHGIPHFDKLHLANLSLKERVQAYLESLAKMVSDTKSPGGCFIAASTCESGSTCLPSGIVETVTGINETSLNALTDFFRNEQENGHCPDSKSPEQLADFLLTIQFGLAVMARCGAKQARLKQVIADAVSVFS